MSILCQYCEHKFSTISNLNFHQKTAKFCLKFNTVIFSIDKCVSRQVGSKQRHQFTFEYLSWFKISFQTFSSKNGSVSVPVNCRCGRRRHSPARSNQKMNFCLLTVDKRSVPTRGLCMSKNLIKTLLSMTWTPPSDIFFKNNDLWQVGFKSVAAVSI